MPLYFVFVESGWGKHMWIIASLSAYKGILLVNHPWLLEFKRPEGTRLLEKIRFDLLPGNDIRGVLLMPTDAVVKLGALRVCQ